MELNLPTWGTGIPCNDKRAHARVVSLLLIISLQLKTPVFEVENQSECFNVLFYLKNRKFIYFNIQRQTLHSVVFEYISKYNKKLICYKFL